MAPSPALRAAAQTFLKWSDSETALAVAACQEEEHHRYQEIESKLLVSERHFALTQKNEAKVIAELECARSDLEFVMAALKELGVYMLVEKGEVVVRSLVCDEEWKESLRQLVAPTNDQTSSSLLHLEQPTPVQNLWTSAPMDAIDAVTILREAAERNLVEKRTLEKRCRELEEERAQLKDEMEGKVAELEATILLLRGESDGTLGCISPSQLLKTGFPGSFGSSQSSGSDSSSPSPDGPRMYLATNKLGFDQLLT